LLNFVNASQFIIQDYSGKSEEFGVGGSDKGIDFLALTPSETIAQPKQHQGKSFPIQCQNYSQSVFLKNEN
jgi:hypothetical protein